MTFKERYEINKQELFTDKNICGENRDLFKKFFSFQEVKLRRMNGITTLDEPAYKTLIGYIQRFRKVNGWFSGKPWKDITKEEFEEVFTALADGKMITSNGKPLEDIDSYVFKIFKGKIFKLAGLSGIVEESLEFYKSCNTTQAKFIEDKDMQILIDHISKPKMKLLFTLAYDVGENVSGLLQLRKKDCRKVFNEVTKEYEYHIHLRKDTLKRTRLERTEPTRLNKSVELLDFVLKDLDSDDFLFTRQDNMVRSGQLSNNIPLSLRSAEIFFDRLVERLKIKLIPTGEKPKLKDIRSSMACDCLRLGWSIEECNSRLGHSVTSRALRPYITFLALDKKKPKIRDYKENIQGLNEKLEEQKNINFVLDKRVKEQGEEMQQLKTLVTILAEKDLKKNIPKRKQEEITKQLLEAIKLNNVS